MIRTCLFGTRRNRNRIRRGLRAEQLERREMLAADILVSGIVQGDNDASGGYQEDSEYIDTVSSGKQGNAPIGERGSDGGNYGSLQPIRGSNGWNRIQDGLAVAEIDDLQFMLEEEKLARDVYMALGDHWDVPIFDNIAAAESQHMQVLGRLIAKYNLVDPVGDNARGVFDNEHLQELYHVLVESGSASIVDAYKVGAMIEELDIVDLQDAIERTDHVDIVQAYDNLMRGSRNHLRAFASRIAAAGETYEAQFLTQEVFDEIANSPMETGNGQNGGGDQGGNGNPGGGSSESGVSPCFGLRFEGDDANDAPSQDRDRDRDQDQDRTRRLEDNHACDGQHQQARDRIFEGLGSQRRSRRS